MSVKYFILWMITSVTLAAQASETEKTYGIETGLVEYKIYGGGVVTPECNLSIEGYEKFSFKAWGDVRIEKMERKETLWGTLYSVEREKTLKKSEKETLYTVDFQNERIITTNLLEGDIGEVDVSRMEKTGTINVASLECELWEERNRKVCLHKGVVLLDEKRYLGLVYGKRADYVNFDLNLSEETFALPVYPLKEDLLMRHMIKTTQTYKSETISDKIISAKETDLNATDKNYAKIFNGIFNELFEKEKNYLSLLLKTMRKTRACLHAARSQSDTSECLKEIIALKSRFNGNGNYTDMLLAEADKEEMLDELDIKIRELKVRMPCINRAANMTDLSACMK
ncbi:hypothetical protein [Sulfurovum sp.]|uniref:hypothetical protein n=1 Tax=Sulfurovum sp. TaxID=1969726 RepID=UPI002A370F3F|nr:hypothetical protein [Sulfurovum sp.]MDD2451984.1 hypothetical protein [Sulfurovum sp.]MDD3499780.1 hypothetical protein [Sulfurovum sp.]